MAPGNSPCARAAIQAAGNEGFACEGGINARGFAGGVNIRPARPSDRKAIVRFLKGEDPHDYVLDAMDRFMGAGRFYLLLDGTKIAGIFHGKLAPDGTAWMSAARVNNAYRGQGWMMRMNAYAVRTAPLRRAHAARMLITHDNTSSLRAAAKGGFKVVSVMSFMDYDLPKRKSRQPPKASGWRKATPDEFLRAARGSKLIAAQGGKLYMTYNGSFELNPRSARAAREWLHFSKEHGPLLAGMFEDDGERWMALQPFRGGAKVARALKRFAAEQGAVSFAAILPASSAVRRPFLKEGYTYSSWASRVLVHERRLPWTTSSRGGAARKPSRR